MLTGQLLVTAVLIAVWIAPVSSWLPSPTAPPDMLGHRTSSHGRPEHIRTSPFRVVVPVVDSVEKLPGDCASGPPGGETDRQCRQHGDQRIDITTRLRVGLRPSRPHWCGRDARGPTLGRCPASFETAAMRPPQDEVW